MSSEQTTRDPAITEAMLPEIDRLIWAIDEMLAPPHPKREALIYLSRGTIRRCLAIAERERADELEQQLRRFTDGMKERERAERTEARAE